MFIFLGIFIIIALWLAYEKNKYNKFSENKSKSFWQRESEADMVRRKDISSLPYINIPYDKLPFSTTQNPEINEVQKKLQLLKEERIINLTGYTNTDLKIEYGAPNLPLLSLYDHNFTLMTRHLYKWASLLIEQGDTASAKTILEFGIECGTDISGNYTLLAKIYADEQDFTSIQDLIEKAENIRTVMKASTIEELRGILNSCY